MASSLLLAAPSASESLPAVSPNETYALTNVTVTLRPGQELSGGAVVLRDGVLQSIGIGMEAPPNAAAIDGTGLFVYPAFFDAHGALEWTVPEVAPDPEAQLDAGSDGVAFMNPSNRKGVRPELSAAGFLSVAEGDGNALRKAGFSTTLIAPEDGLLRGQSAVVSLSGRSRREIVVRKDAAMHASLALGGGGYPGSLMGRIAHLRQVFLDAGHYQREWRWHDAHPQGRRRPPIDLSLESLDAVLAGEQPVVFEVDSKNDIRRAMGLAEEFGFRLMISGGGEAWQLAEELAQKKIPVILSLDFGKEPKNPDGSSAPADRPAKGASTRSEEPESDAIEAAKDASPESDLTKPWPKPLKRRRDEYREWRDRVAGAARLEEAGVLMAFRTKGLKPEDFMKNLRRAIQEGLSAEAALRALTESPASMFGLNRSKGSLEAGKAADLVAFTDRFDRKSARVRYLFSEGRVFEFDLDPGDKKESKEEEGDKAEAGDEPLENDPAQSTPGETETSDPDKASGEVKTPHAEPQFPVVLEAERKPALEWSGAALIQGGVLFTPGPARWNGSTNDIYIRDGRIQAIGADLDVPPEVPRYDASGQYVTPGLIDAHSHMAIDGGVNEGTDIITSEARVPDVIDPEDIAIYRALAGGVTAANLLHGSANAIGGQSATIKLKYRRKPSELLIQDAPRLIKFALGENPKRSNSSRRDRFPRTRLGIEAVYRRAFEQARDYEAAWNRRREAVARGEVVREPRRDLRLEALSEVLNGELQVHSHCYRADEILMLMRVAEDFGWRVNTFQHVLEGYKVAPEIAAHGAAASTFSDWWAYKLEAYDAIPYNAALLDRAGVVTTVNSDSNELVRRMNLEAAKAIKYGGLPETNALALVTINAAKQLGIDGRTGSLEIGKDGDLALWDGHPFSVYSKCVLTVIEGEVFFQRENRWPENPISEKENAKRGDPSAEADAAARETANGAPAKLEVEDETIIALRGATVHSVSAGDIDGGTILIADGQIRAVGRDVSIPEQAQVFELNGLHVYPGLIDAGSLVGLTEIGSVAGSVDYSVAGEFQPDLVAATAVNPHSEHIRVTRVNGVTTTLTAPQGAVIAGQGSLMRLDGWTPAEMTVSSPTTLHIDFPNVPERDDKERWKAYQERLKPLRALFVEAREYGRMRESGGAAGNRDPKLEALLPYTRGEKPVVIEVLDAAEIREALAFGKTMELKTVLANARDAWQVADLIADHDVPVIVGPVLTLPGSRYDPYDAPFHNAAVLHEAGVRIAFRTGDSSNARHLPYHAAMAVAHGLPRKEAIKALTLSAAEILGAEAVLGSIEPGKEASLLVTDGDPLEIRTQVKHVFIRGRPISLETRHTELYRKFSERLRKASGEPDI